PASIAVSAPVTRCANATRSLAQADDLATHSGASMKSDPKSATGLRVEQVRARLQGTRGPAYWRSLEELAGTEEFAELIHREFPQMLPLEESSTSRRRFLQLMGASLALAGLNACSIQPDEKILPYA